MNKTIKISDLTPEAVNGYKWVVMYRDHYRGNGKGEYFAASDLAEIRAQQPFWFDNTDRPVHTVILTNDDVPAIIETRCLIINGIQNLRHTIETTARPPRNFDGRKTRKTAPELYAAYDRALADYTAQINRLKSKKTALQTTLDGMQNYSTTLLRIYAK